jgi:glycosyltransferase involved in cell wall biosynthesis
LRINTWLARFSRIWRRRDFAYLQQQGVPVIYHATNYEVDRWIAARAAATCLTVFDMISELLCDEPSRARSVELKRRGVSLARGIFCISQQTLRDFLQFFPQCEKRTTVTPLAPSLPVSGPEELTAVERHKPYLLLVGNRLGYKNGVSALRAFTALAVRHSRLRILCFGGEPLSSEEQVFLASTGLQPRVDRVRGDDRLLAACYAQAAALLYPSRYEGFGLPVLEAMQSGCPVITTRCGSLPDVGGDAAVYVDPDDAAGLAGAVDRLLQDQNWRHKRIEAGYAQCARFRWSKTAEATRVVYERLLQPLSRQGGTGTAESFQASSGSKTA